MDAGVPPSDDQAELDRFAELLMRLVRDRTIATCDRLAAGRMGGPAGARWRDLVEGASAHRAVRELIPDIVDQTLWELLHRAETGDLPLAWRRADGSPVPLEELGANEMAGWLMATDEDGWRSRFSTQRFFNPFPDE